MERKAGSNLDKSVLMFTDMMSSISYYWNVENGSAFTTYSILFVAFPPCNFKWDIASHLACSCSKSLSIAFS